MSMFLLLLACATPADCRDGFSAGADGLCYEDAAPAEGDGDDTGGDDTDPPTDTDAEPPTIEDVLDALPACEPVADDGRIDLATGCVDGVCPGTTYDGAVATIGEEPSCTVFYYDFGGYTGGSLSCAWPSGIELDFDDEDQDGVPDAGSTAFSVGLNEDFDGGTPDGLGIGATMACFVDALGYPDAVSIELVDKDWIVSYGYWPDAGVSARDSYGPRDSYDPDGKIDALTLYGGSGDL